MLGGLKPLGVVGLGILPGPLRKPLGVSRLVRPEDYAGKTLAFQRSQVAQQTLRALGARGAEIPSAGAIDAYDGVEQQVDSIDGNGYDKLDKYLTANVNLWPRPIVLFMNSTAFDGLSGRQRAALRDAARVALPATLAAEQASEQEGAESLCRRGVHVRHGQQRRPGGAASRGAARLRPTRARRADQGRDRADPGHALRSGLPPPTRRRAPTPARRSSAARKATPIDGVYRRAHDAGGPARGGSVRGRGRPRELRQLRRWSSIAGASRNSSRQGDSAAGTYTVAGDTLTLTFTRSAGGHAQDQARRGVGLPLEPVPRPAHARARRGQGLAHAHARQAVAANRERALIRSG